MKLTSMLTASVVFAFAIASLGPMTLAQAASSTSAAPLVSISDEGGFVPPVFQSTNLPALIAYQIPKTNSALVLIRNDNSTLPNASQMLSTRVDATRLQTHIKAIYVASAAPKSGWGVPGVADVPSTRVIVNSGSMHKNQSVYALNFSNGPQVSPSQAKARKALAGAIASLKVWVSKAKTKKYAPANYELWIHSPVAKTGGVGIANPASVFCTSMQGTLEILNSPDGEVGVCALPDGSRIDEWEYYRTESVKLALWPNQVKVPTFVAPRGGCAVATSGSVKTVISSARKPGPLLLPSGQALQVSLRPVLPGERACKRFG